MKKMMKQFEMIFASALLAAALSNSVFADDPVTANTPVSGPTVTFDKYLVMKENANVPNTAFSFQVTAGDAVTAAGEATEVYAGTEASKVTVSNTAVFAPGDSTSGTVKPNDTLTLEAGKKYADKQVTLDFSGVTYTDPGIYRYVVTESQVDTENGFTITDGDTRYLDIYIESDDHGVLSCAGTVLHRTTEIINLQGGAYDGSFRTETNINGKKPTGYTNEYTTYDLYLEKQVTGNQGNRNAYFEFEVEITGAIRGTVYDVVLPAVANHRENPAKLTCDENGSVKATYYLKDNQKICIQGLTARTQYKVTEILDDGKGYTVTYDNHGTKGSGKTFAATRMDDNVAKDDNSVLFTNRKEGIIPTGIFLEAAPFLATAVAALIGLLLLKLNRHGRGAGKKLAG